MKTDIIWIRGPRKGRLAIAARPRGGDWLDDEVEAWRSAGVDCVVSALTPAEEAELDLAEEPVICQRHGLRYISLPIPDSGVPSSRPTFIETLDCIRADLDEENILAATEATAVKRILAYQIKKEMQECQLTK